MRKEEDSRKTRRERKREYSRYPAIIMLTPIAARRREFTMLLAVGRRAGPPGDVGGPRHLRGCTRSL
ncbi:hypothetical protein GCM10009793_06660 [Brachybacterium phenoliresistens]